LRDFDCFCPKSLARIGGFQGTLLDRGVVIHLEKAPKGWPHSRRKIVNREAAPLRENLEAYALQCRARLQELYDSEPDEGYWPELSGREAEVLGPLLLHAKLAGPEVERRALAVALEFSRKKVQIALSEDRNLSLAQEILEVVRALEWGTFSPGDMVPLLAQKEQWAEKLARAKTEQAKVCSVGRFLSGFRFPSRKRTRTGSTYDRTEVLEMVRRHTPEPIATNATNATQPVNTQLPEVASPPNETASSTNDAAADQREPAQVAISAGEAAMRPGGNATRRSRINTGSVACGNSNGGDTQGVLKY